MNAKDLVKLNGKALIGCVVTTEAVGDYPGGKAVVTKISPDQGAPEIVCTVDHPTDGEMGIFENEEIEIVDVRKEACK